MLFGIAAPSNSCRREKIKLMYYVNLPPERNGTAFDPSSHTEGSAPARGDSWAVLRHPKPGPAVRQVQLERHENYFFGRPGGIGHKALIFLDPGAYFPPFFAFFHRFLATFPPLKRRKKAKKRGKPVTAEREVLRTAA